MLVVDASVALKLVLAEEESHIAADLVRSGEPLALPDFWLQEAANVLWVQVHRSRMTMDAAREALALLQALLPVTATTALDLQREALEIGLVIDHSPYDTAYVAFARAIGARAVVVADERFASAMQRHPAREMRAMLVLLSDWARSRGVPSG